MSHVNPSLYRAALWNRPGKVMHYTNPMVGYTSAGALARVARVNKAHEKFGERGLERRFQRLSCERSPKEVETSAKCLQIPAATDVSPGRDHHRGKQQKLLSSSRAFLCSHSHR